MQFTEVNATLHGAAEGRIGLEVFDESSRETLDRHRNSVRRIALASAEIFQRKREGAEILARISHQQMEWDLDLSYNVS